MNRLPKKGRCPVKCSDARHLIRLSVGDDNLPDEEQALGEHLHRCSDCRSYNAGMVDAMQVLHDFRDNTAVATDLSVWPSVERRIENRRILARASQQPQRQFHGGIVALCACSLVLAFVTIVQNLPANQGTAGMGGPLEGMIRVNEPVNPDRPNQRLTVPGNQRFLPLRDPQNREVLILRDPAAIDSFLRAVNAHKVPNGLQKI